MDELPPHRTVLMMLRTIITSVYSVVVRITKTLTKVAYVLRALAHKPPRIA